MDVLDRIRSLCAERSCSIQKLEKETGIGNGTVGRWGTSSPRADRLAAVADYFNVSMDWLMGRTLTDLSPRALEIARAYDQADDKSRALARMALIEEITAEKKEKISG